MADDMVPTILRQHGAMQAISLIEAQQAEIERLRQRGDGLVAVISNCECVAHERCGWCVAKDKWKEAKNG